MVPRNSIQDKMSRRGGVGETHTATISESKWQLRQVLLEKKTVGSALQPSRPITHTGWYRHTKTKIKQKSPSTGCAMSIFLFFFPCSRLWYTSCTGKVCGCLVCYKKKVRVDTLCGCAFRRSEKIRSRSSVSLWKSPTADKWRRKNNSTYLVYSKYTT